MKRIFLSLLIVAFVSLCVWETPKHKEEIYVEQPVGLTRKTVKPALESRIMKVPKDSKIDSIGLSETGNATYYYYNTKRIAANGSVYDPTAMTCAYYRHTNAKRKYLNRQVRVCTDTCIVLTVTDNGAFRDGKLKKLNRVIDLTPYAFKLLGGVKNQGILKNVKVEVLGQMKQDSYSPSVQRKSK